MKMKHVNIAQLKQLVDNNAHTDARLHILESLKSEYNHFEGLISGYNHINAEHHRQGFLPHAQGEYRRILDQQLKHAINDNCINNKQVLAAL